MSKSGNVVCVDVRQIKIVMNKDNGGRRRRIKNPNQHLLYQTN